jgi:hypothetical protein
MADSSINVTEGSGKRLHTWDRTISSTLVQDQFTLPGEYPVSSYVALANGISIATANDHIIQVMAGSSLKVRIRRVRVSQSAYATTAGAGFFELWRLSSAGTGGTSLTPRQMDFSDSASGATSMTLPSAKGSEQYLIDRERLMLGQSTTLIGTDFWEWAPPPGFEPLIVNAGTANGIAIKSTAAIAGGSVNVAIYFIETSF